jgi:hypothetical protein
VTDKEPLKIKGLEHGGIEKVEQLFLDMLQSAPQELVGDPNPTQGGRKEVQLAVEYDFSSIITEWKSKLIFFFRAALRPLIL